MDRPSDFARGIDFLRRVCENAGIAFLSQELDTFDRGTIPVSLGKAVEAQGRMISKTVCVMLSHNFLSDLPATREYQEKLRAYLTALSSRLESPNENAFQTLNGIPIEVEIDWPLRLSPDGRDGYFVRVGTRAGVLQDRQANFGVIVSGTVKVSAFPSLVPIFTESAVLNSVRKAIDERNASFHEEGSHPATLQQASLVSTDFDYSGKEFRFLRASDAEIRQFIEAKVYWLGFRAGSPDTDVWIADVYDAHYLGTTPARMQQIAAVLAAQEVIHLDTEKGFASASKGLLKMAEKFERELESALRGMDRTPETHGKAVAQPAETGQKKWDVFISHASEDKEEIARPLAEALKDQGYAVWYDKFTLKLGDSLRKSIDRGLAESRYGVVILSKHFFAKHWPVQELNGLAALEVSGEKVILPVWHGVIHSDVVAFSPTLADRLAVSTDNGLDKIVASILEVISPPISKDLHETLEEAKRKLADLE